MCRCAVFFCLLVGQWAARRFASDASYAVWRGGLIIVIGDGSQTNDHSDDDDDDDNNNNNNNNNNNLWKA
jgi:hypothetical protein